MKDAESPSGASGSSMPAAAGAPAAHPDAALRALPFLARFRLYLAERFPLAAYAVLIALLYLACDLTAQASLGPGPVRIGWRALAAYAVFFLLFFHLRLLDEFKDYEEDLVVNPERIVQRGIVRLDELRPLVLAAIALELIFVLALAFAGGGVPLATVGLYLAVLFYSLLMYKEFFAGERLKQDYFVYALTHEPIMVLAALFIFSVVAAPRGIVLPPPSYWLTAALALLLVFSFELSRNTRSPEEDRAKPGDRNYSKRFGPRRAAFVAFGITAAGGLSGAALGWALGLGLWYSAAAVGLLMLPLGAAIRFCRALDPKTSKALGEATALYALAVLLLLAVAVLLSRGLAFR